jgi:ring-1,2-phenylacetyl-CoA epoxidase subunit PaaC
VTERTHALALALADDELLMGHHHSEWICVAPFLEEDLAFCSIGQDELGHANSLYRWLLGEDASGGEIDHFALRRPPAEYRSSWLAERPTPEWADALVRHWLYDTAEVMRWEALADAGDDGLRGLVAGAVREETYHRRHADAMLERLLRGTDESRARIETALATLAPLAAGMFELDPDRYPDFAERCDELLDRCGVAVDWPSMPPVGGGQSGARSEEFAAVHARMNVVLDLDPDTAW